MAFPLELRFAGVVGAGETIPAALPRQGTHRFDAQPLSLVAAKAAPTSLEDVIAECLPFVAGLASEAVGCGRSMISGAQTLAAVVARGASYTCQAVSISTLRAKSGIGTGSAPVPLLENLIAHPLPPVASRAFERVMIAPGLPLGREALATVLGGLCVQVCQPVL